MVDPRELGKYFDIVEPPSGIGSNYVLLTIRDVTERIEVPVLEFNSKPEQSDILPEIIYQNANFREKVLPFVAYTVSNGDCNIRIHPEVSEPLIEAGYIVPWEKENKIQTATFTGVKAFERFIASVHQEGEFYRFGGIWQDEPFQAEVLYESPAS